MHFWSFSSKRSRIGKISRIQRHSRLAGSSWLLALSPELITTPQLRALLEPTAELRKLEAAGDYTARLALLEEQKSLPWQAVWEMYCQRHDTPAGSEWLESVRAYEKEILSQRG